MEIPDTLGEQWGCAGQTTSQSPCFGKMVLYRKRPIFLENFRADSFLLYEIYPKQTVWKQKRLRASTVLVLKEVWGRKDAYQSVKR